MKQDAMNEFAWWLDMETYQPYVHGDVLSSEECDRIVAMANNPSLSLTEDAEVYTQNGNNVKPETRDTRVHWIKTAEDNRWLFDKVTAFVNEVNRQFFDYKLDFIQNLQLGEYRVGGFYKPHVDVEPYSERTRKLSFSIQLSKSEDYEGGDLVLNTGDLFTAPRKQGAMIVFPSYTVHEVTPVTQGVRYSLVGWVAGPKWR